MFLFKAKNCRKWSATAETKVFCFFFSKKNALLLPQDDEGTPVDRGQAKADQQHAGIGASGHWFVEEQPTEDEGAEREEEGDQHCVGGTGGGGEAEEQGVGQRGAEQRDAGECGPGVGGRGGEGPDAVGEDAQGEEQDGAGGELAGGDLECGEVAEAAARIGRRRRS